jgi:quercetin dioxygenase-like cupin family protein
MTTQKIRWSRVYESSEEELLALLKSRNIEATRFVGEAGSEALQQTAKPGSVIWCAEGSLTVQIESVRTSLQPGDALRLGTELSYDVVAGISGYVCYLSS